MIPAPEQQTFALRGQVFLRWTQRFFFLIGLLAISYVALSLLNARFYQEVANHTLDQQIHAEEEHGASLSPIAANQGDIMGRIEIPRLGMKIAILEGTTPRALRLGVGHIEGTAAPGEAGNIGIAGHRDTYFRALKDIRTSDEIQIQTAAGVSRYEVDWVRIVEPDDVGVLAPSAASGITLVTCYPFHFLGTAPQRFVVHARSAELKQSTLGNE